MNPQVDDSSFGVPPTQHPPAGWMPDPANPSQWRYWDGVAWTGHVAPPSLPHGGGVYVQPKQTNGLAIASLVCSLSAFVIPLVGTIPGIILGHIARSQIRASNGSQSGNGLAVAGLVIGYLFLALLAWLIFLLRIDASGS